MIANSDEMQMKTCLRKPLLLPALLAGVVVALAGRAAAQTFTVLHSFTWPDTNGINSDGAGSINAPVLVGNTLYGTAPSGGSAGNGTVFAVNTDGTGFTVLHSFAATPSSPPYVNSDGANPNWLTLSGSTLYGVASSGGSSGSGTIFSVNTDGTDFAVLYSFTTISQVYGTNGDGGGPLSLISSGGRLYGTAVRGGTSGQGTVFAVKTDGSGFATLHNGGSSALVLSTDMRTLYGTTSGGNGAVFSVNIDGTGFTVLHRFAGNAHQTGLILSGSTLFGATLGLGGLAVDTVFKLKTDGTGFTSLYNYETVSGEPHPAPSVVLLGNTLYGTTYNAGSRFLGSVYKTSTDGTDSRTLYSLLGGTNGALPCGSLVLSGHTLYGTTYGDSYGFSEGSTVAFRLLIPAELTIARSGANVLLSWPTNFTGLTLESSTNLGLPAIWTSDLPAPVVVNGQNIVTNPVSGTQRLFRLAQ